MQNAKKESYLSRNMNWLSPLLILFFIILSTLALESIGENNVIPDYILKIIAVIALLISGFNARLTQTLSARIFNLLVTCLVITFFIFLIGYLGFLVFKSFAWNI